MAARRPIRFRYSLRALLVVVTLAAIWCGYNSNRGWNERAAEKVLLGHGAHVVTEAELWESGRLPTATVVYRKLRACIWGERFIRSVTLTSSLEPEVVGAIANLPHLQCLEVTPVLRRDWNRRPGPGEVPPARPPITAINRMLSGHDLTELKLDEWHLSTTDFNLISQEETLTVLHVNFSGLTDEGLLMLIDLPSLCDLSFDSCPATGKLLASHQGSASLNKVRCHETPAGLEFASFISRCPNVRDLSASTSLHIDDFVSELSPHPSLAHLYVSPCSFSNVSHFDQNITDASIPQLKLLSALESVGRTSFSVKGATDLRRAHPNLLLDE